MGKLPQVVYWYRGPVEKPKQVKGRPAGYKFVDGFSEQGAHGPCYPWMTRRECLLDARKRGVRALFRTEARGQEQDQVAKAG